MVSTRLSISIGSRVYSSRSPCVRFCSSPPGSMTSIFVPVRSGDLITAALSLGMGIFSLIAICTRTFREGFCRVTFVTFPIVTSAIFTGAPLRNPCTCKNSANSVIEFDNLSGRSARYECASSIANVASKVAP